MSSVGVVCSRLSPNSAATFGAVHANLDEIVLVELRTMSDLCAATVIFETVCAATAITVHFLVKTLMEDFLRPFKSATER
jgi:hypothetical protein